MMVDFKDGYLALSEGVEVHLTPEEASVFPKNLGLRCQNVHYVNQLGAEALLECNGLVTEKELKLKLKQKFEKETLISNFLEESLRRGIISLENEPSFRSARITGSRKYFIPVHFLIELTPQCNLRCIYCYNESGSSKDQKLSSSELLTCLVELYKSGVRIVELTGGEPLMHPNFLDIFNFCGTHFSLIAILTNGTLLTTLAAEQIAKYKDKVFAQIDLDGSTSTIHDMLRGVTGSFERAKNAINLLAKNGVFVKVAMNLTRANFDDIEGTLLVAKQCGATMFSYAPITDVGRAKNLNLGWTLEQIAKLQELPKYLYEKYGNFFFQLTEKQIEYLSKTKNCGAGYRSCVLGPKGEVRPCPLLPENYLTLGNLLTSSMEEIFQNPLVSYLSRLKAPTPDICPDCPYQMYCGFCFIKSIYVQEKTGTVCNWAKSSGFNSWFDLGKIKNPKGNYTACLLPSRDKAMLESG